MATLMIWCLVYGSDATETFEVDISGTATVAALKKAIKKKRAANFGHVDHSALALYCVPVPEDVDQLERCLQEWDLKGSKPLLPPKLLSKLDLSRSIIIAHHPEPSSNRPNSGTQDTQAPVMILNCWVRGEPYVEVFPVKISPTELVGTLKNFIKDIRVDFGDINASTLALYKVSLPVDGDIDEALSSLTLSQAHLLYPTRDLFDCFPDAPLKGHIHIVVEAPLSMRPRPHPVPSATSISLHNIAIQRGNYIDDHISIAPSSAGMSSQFALRQAASKRTIYCNRPHDAYTPIPPTLLHEVFGQFLDDCESGEVTKDDDDMTEELRIAMSRFYGKEWQRAQEFRRIFAEHNLTFLVTHTDQNYITDGDMSHKGCRYAIAEVKNEVGAGGAEPYSQASLYYLEATKKYAVEMWNSSLPCIFILLFGSYIGFAGATWNTRPVVQSLSLVLPMHFHPTDTGTQTKVARHLMAFKNAIRTLHKYYEVLENNGPPSFSPDITHLFPYRTHFTSLQDQTQHRFTCLQQPFSEKLLFYGNLLDGRPICIKYVRRYSQDAHEKCASLGYAPKLHGFETVPGGWFMVVMDRLDSGEYVELRHVSPTASLTNNIRNALRQLHEANYVHGDVRDTNIMVSVHNKTEFMLIDFDWAGKFNEARYPANVTRTANLWRPDGAIDRAFIRPEHDMDMLVDIERRYRIVQ